MRHDEGRGVGHEAPDLQTAETQTHSLEVKEFIFATTQAESLVGQNHGDYGIVIILCTKADCRNRFNWRHGSRNRKAPPGTRLSSLHHFSGQKASLPMTVGDYG